MTELEKRIDFGEVGVKALRARWRDVRRLINDVAKANPEDSQIRPKFLSDVKVIGKSVRGVRPAALHPTLDGLSASFEGAEASLAKGFQILEIFENESHAPLVRRGDVDSVSEPDPLRTAPDQRITDQWDADDREILARALPAEHCVLWERVAADRVTWDDEFAVGVHHEDPVSTGHAVIILRRHEPDFVALPEPAHDELRAITREVRAGVAEEHGPDGWTVLIDSGRTVDHPRVHLIPRSAGEIPSSRGGD
jgi:diadenosine tetraphosphate (Ap4A) HIT family hydrolase